MSTEISVDRSNPDEPVLLFKRHLPHSVDRVWAAITNSEDLSQWFPCQLEIEPREGGLVTFTFEGEPPEESRVAEFDPPHVIAYVWSGEHLRWTIEPDGDGSILRLSNTIIDPDWMPRTAAGWDTCIEVLRAVLAGEPFDHITGPDETEIESYRKMLM